MTVLPARHRVALQALLLVLAVVEPAAHAEQTTASPALPPPAGTPDGFDYRFNTPLSANARLDFQVNMGKFIFFRLGNSAYPVADGSVSSASFTMVVPPGLTLAPGNSQAIVWSGAVPGYSTTTLPVEVRSNAGQVTLRARVLAQLASGANTIPLSGLTITSSDPGLPAPLVPNAGTGPSVNVAGTSFANLVTQRTAAWTFSLVTPATQPAGTYNGQIQFIASTP
jgi:hypothetical protein